jgi:hypothetical protein
MRSYRGWLLLVWLLGHMDLAGAVSDAPLRALNAYIEQNGTCSEQLIEWNRRYNPRTVAGETSRNFYYRVLGYQDWGRCGRPYFRSILGELQKIWIIFAKGQVSEAEFEAKEAELINLWFTALKDEKNGEQIVQAYESKTATRLIGLVPPKQFFNCTFFGDQAHCTD